ncbi:Casein kinase I isoform gamma-2 [Dermatophagoides pteronyssinus]|uniref:Casein kinase I isoform gamma-2 n=1 Tax=Dermatophagoides pteronyssinus TaxID=6956 RepID=A0ABQ8JLX6_DERPT|nr:Casein kinase I isoform gamma-2 [Dermatophagoides pteronyssinus]
MNENQKTLKMSEKSSSNQQTGNESMTTFPLEGAEIKDSSYVLIQGLSIAAGPLPGLPKVYHFGECGPYYAMVMELLGPNLEQLMVANNSRFSLRTTTQIAIMILEIMRSVHSKKIIFCNVKPENFCLGRPNTAKSNQVYMVGLINAKLFETADSKHIPKISANDTEQEPKKFGVYGTPRYMSLHAHKGKELSRRDDLESIGYMLLYFLHGKLPWQGLPINNSTSNNNSEKYENIFITKKMIHLDELCANLPPEYYHYMLYVRSLKFAQEPNYRYLITMFTKLLYRINMDQSRLVSPSLMNDMAITFDEQLLSSLNNNNNSNNNKNESSSSSKKQVSFKMDHETLE